MLFHIQFFKILGFCVAGECAHLEFPSLFLVLTLHSAEASLLMKTISEIVAHMIQAHNSNKNFDVQKLKVQSPFALLCVVANLHLPRPIIHQPTALKVSLRPWRSLLLCQKSIANIFYLGIPSNLLPSPHFSFHSLASKPNPSERPQVYSFRAPYAILL